MWYMINSRKAFNLESTDHICKRESWKNSNMAMKDLERSGWFITKKILTVKSQLQHHAHNEHRICFFHEKGRISHKSTTSSSSVSVSIIFGCKRDSRRKILVAERLATGFWSRSDLCRRILFMFSSMWGGVPDDRDLVTGIPSFRVEQECIQPPTSNIFSLLFRHQTNEETVNCFLMISLRWWCVT